MSDANPWLERIGWAQHTAGFTFEQMIPWAIMPHEDEIALQRICGGFVRMIDKAQQWMLGPHCTFFARVEINRKEEGKTANKPFEARMGEDTKKRYCEVWQRVICYVYRTHQMDRRPRYRLTPSQQEALTGLIQLAQQAEEEGEREGEREGESEGESDGIEEGDEKEAFHDSGCDEPPDQPELRPIERQCLTYLDSRMSGRFDGSLVTALTNTWQQHRVDVDGGPTKL